MSAAEGLTLTLSLTVIFLGYFASILAFRERTGWWAIAKGFGFAFFASTLLAGRIAWLIDYIQEVPR